MKSLQKDSFVILKTTVLLTFGGILRPFVDTSDGVDALIKDVVEEQALRRWA